MRTASDTIEETSKNRGNEGYAGACALVNKGQLCPLTPRISPDISLNSSPALNSYTPKTVVRGPWPTLKKKPVAIVPVKPPQVFHTTTLLGEPVTRERILRLLASEPMQTAYDIAKAINTKKTTVKTALKFLERRRVVTFELIASPHTKGNQLVRHYSIKS